MAELMWELERKIKDLQSTTESICDYERPCKLIKLLDIGINSIRVNEYHNMYYKTATGEYIHDDGYNDVIVEANNPFLQQNVYFKNWDNDDDGYIILHVSTKPVPEEER